MAIKLQELEEAMTEALRFLKAAKEYCKSSEKNDYGGTVTWLDGGKDAANMKRKSMDLTRALAKLRR